MPSPPSGVRVILAGCHQGISGFSDNRKHSLCVKAQQWKRYCSSPCGFKYVAGGWYLYVLVLGRFLIATKLEPISWSAETLLPCKTKMTFGFQETQIPALPISALNKWCRILSLSFCPGWVLGCRYTHGQWWHLPLLVALRNQWAWLSVSMNEWALAHRVSAGSSAFKDLMALKEQLLSL